MFWNFNFFFLQNSETVEKRSKDVPSNEEEKTL